MAQYNQPEKVANCCLCKEIETGLFPAEYAAVYGVDKRICFENDNFFVIPSVSPIALGHTMLLPKRHYTSMMACPDELKEEALLLIDMLYEKLSAKFGELLIFEHGVGNINDVACGINHAHLHFVPCSTSCADSVISSVNIELGFYKEEYISKLLSCNVLSSSYLMIGNNIDTMRLYYENKVPSQIVRRSFANVMNTSSWDWKTLYGNHDFVETIKCLM